MDITGLLKIWGGKQAYGRIFYNQNKNNISWNNYNLYKAYITTSSHLEKTSTNLSALKHVLNDDIAHFQEYGTN